MNKVIHRSQSRGYSDHGWLKSYHTFSFADYYHAQRMHFGALRVLNDDLLSPGEGFGPHPHDNMEIVTVPLSGVLRHNDSMGNAEELRPGEIQVMTAGTGLTHSEYNGSREHPAELLQIWVETDARGYTPRYERVALYPAKCNAFRVIVAPEGCGSEHVGWIHQTAWFYTLDLDAGHATAYRMNVHGNGAYLFVLDGHIEAAGEELHTRDGMGIWEADKFLLKGVAPARLLIIEVPME